MTEAALAIKLHKFFGLAPYSPTPIGNPSYGDPKFLASLIDQYGADTVQRIIKEEGVWSDDLLALFV